MGMFDSIYDEGGLEWQTKAFQCLLESFTVGSEVELRTEDYSPHPLKPWASRSTYQVEIYSTRDSLATVKDNCILAIDCERNELLPLYDYVGTLHEPGIIARRNKALEDMQWESTIDAIM